MTAATRRPLNERLQRPRDDVHASLNRVHVADIDENLPSFHARWKKDWKYVQQYADAKTEIVLEILGRAEAA